VSSRTAEASSSEAISLLRLNLNPTTTAPVVPASTFHLLLCIEADHGDGSFFLAKIPIAPASAGTHPSSSVGADQS